MSSIGFIGSTVNERALLHQVDGMWQTCWGGQELTAGSKSMAALKMLHDIMEDNEGDGLNAFRGPS